MDKPRKSLAGNKPRKRGLSVVSKRWTSDGDESDVEPNQESSKLDLASKLRAGNEADPSSQNLFAKSVGSSKHEKIAGKSEFQEMVAKDEKYANYVKKDEVDVPKVVKSKHKHKLSDDNEKINAPKAVAFALDNVSVSRSRQRARSRAASMFPDPNDPNQIIPLLGERHSSGGFVVDPTHKFRRPRPSIIHLFQEDEDEDDHESTENLDYDKNNIPSKNEADVPALSKRLKKKITDQNILKRIYSRKAKKPYKQTRLTKQRARALFGNNSRLAQAHFEVILRMFREASDEEKSASLDSGPSYGPDLSWIQEYSEKDLLEDPDFVNMPSNHRRRLTSKMFAAFAPVWYPMIFLGRMPFSGGVNMKTGFLEIELRRKSCRFVTFCLTSLLIFVIMTLSIVSTFLSYNEFEHGKVYDRLQELKPNPTKTARNTTIHPYTQLEVLYLEKHWLPYTLLMLVFLFTTICNIALIVSGQHTAKVISDIVNTSVSFQIDASKWIWTMCLGGQIAIGFGALYKTVMCIWQYTVYENEVNEYLAMSSTRLFYKYIRTKLDVFPFLEPPFLLIQLYGTYAAATHIILPAVLAIAIDNIATHWNFRLGLLIGKIKVTTSKLRWIKRQLNYEFMFKCHIIIRDMVFFYSMKGFATVLISWYCVMIAGFCCVLFRIARVAGIDFNPNQTTIAELPKTTVEYVNIKYSDPRSYMFFDSASFLLILTVTLLTVTEGIGRVGRTVMENGFGYLRRHGLIGCRSPHERRLVMSLYQCFSARHPCVITPGNLFKIDRRFIIAIVEMIMVLFTTMMQARVNQLIQHEILGLCETGVCVVGYAKANGANEEFLTKNLQTVLDPGSEKDRNDALITLPAAPLLVPPVVILPPPPIGKPLPLPVVIIPSLIGKPLPIGKPAPIGKPRPIGKPTPIGKPLPPSIGIPPPPPEALLPILNPKQNKDLYQRCRKTDIVRQRIYTRVISSTGEPIFTPVALPTDELNCFINYYRPKNPGEEFYDALGQPLDLSSFDSCGMPSLPKIKYYDPNKLTKSDVAILKDRTKYYTKRIRVTTKGGRNKYECQEEENLYVDPSLLIMSDTGSTDWALKPTVCNLPSLFVDVYCKAWKKSVDSGVTTVDLGTTLQTRINLVDASKKKLLPVHGCEDPDDYRHNLFIPAATGPFIDFANEIGVTFRLGMNPRKPSSIDWGRQNYRLLGTVTNQPTATSFSENFGRLKKTHRSIFLPYPLQENLFIYDCNGERIKIDYDDCGFLPFQITRDTDGDGKHEWIHPGRKPFTYNYFDPDTKMTHTATGECWEQQFPDFLCGARLFTDARDQDFYLYKLCSTFDTFYKAPPGKFSTDYIPED